jgi:hypothetical protein
MGNDDAPNAPAGWYPIETGEPGERHWDGVAWDGNTRQSKNLKVSIVPRLPRKTRRLSRKQMLWVGVSLVAIVPLLIFLLPMSPSDEENLVLASPSPSVEVLIGGVVVPDLIGVQGTVAQQQLEALGFTVVVDDSIPAPESSPGTVLQLSPPAGRSVERGSRITMMVVSVSVPTDFDYSTPDSVVEWYPEGYSRFSDDLALKWVDAANSGGCTNGCRYSTMEVISSRGCPRGLYVEVNFLSGGVIVDWSNDTVPSLATSQVAQLQFVSYETNIDSTQVASMSCR